MSCETFQTVVLPAGRYGFSEIPVGEDKKPLISSWKQFQIQAPSQPQVEEWDRQLHPAAWAIVTGSVSQVFVLDFDGEVGNATMRRHGLNPHIRTGSGGHHLYVRHPGWKVPTMAGKVKSQLGRLLPGMDIRGDGGYAIFAGRNSQGPYELLRALEPDPFESLPDEIQQALKWWSRPDAINSEGTLPAANGRVRAQRLIEMALARVAEGEGRNAAGFNLAVQLRDNGYEESEAILVLDLYRQWVPPWNQKGLMEPYGADEAHNSVQQAYSRPPRAPWTGNGTRGQSGATDLTGCQGAADELPSIVLSGLQLREATSQVLNALRARNNPPVLFVRAGELVCASQDECGRTGILQVSNTMLRSRLTRCANFYFRSEAQGRPGTRPVYPSMEVVNDVLSLPSNEWGFPALDGVVEAPILRPDGSLLTTPGYDAYTEVVYLPPPDLVIPPIPDQPTDADLVSAVSLIQEMLCDFLFVDPSSRAHAFAMLITPLIRRSVEGNVPAAIVTAPTPASGKGLLCETVSIIHSGDLAAMKPAPSSDGEEWRKTLTAELASGNNLTILDNVEHRVKSPHLASVLTSGIWRDRILGQSKIITLPQRTTFIINGNNVLLGGDMPRRCYWIQMDPQMSEPHKRTGFKHQPLQAWVKARRGELLAALLTMCRSWYVNGCPGWGGMVLGSFENWSKAIGGILANAGVVGFLENFDEHFRQADDTTPQWESFLNAIWERYEGSSFTLKQLVFDVETNTVLRELVPDELSDDGRKMSPSLKYSYAFRKRIGRRYGSQGIHIVKGKENRNGVMVWKVVIPGRTDPPNASPVAPPPGVAPDAPPPRRTITHCGVTVDID